MRKSSGMVSGGRLPKPALGGHSESLRMAGCRRDPRAATDFAVGGVHEAEIEAPSFREATELRKRLEVSVVGAVWVQLFRITTPGTRHHVDTSRQLKLRNGHQNASSAGLLLLTLLAAQRENDRLAFRREWGENALPRQPSS